MVATASLAAEAHEMMQALCQRVITPAAGRKSRGKTEPTAHAARLVDGSVTAALVALRSATWKAQTIRQRPTSLSDAAALPVDVFIPGDPVPNVSPGENAQVDVLQL
jgi:hypothetical protein